MRRWNPMFETLASHVQEFEARESLNQEHLVLLLCNRERLIVYLTVDSQDYNSKLCKHFSTHIQIWSYHIVFVVGIIWTVCESCKQFLLQICNVNKFSISVRMQILVVAKVQIKLGDQKIHTQTNVFIYSIWHSKIFALFQLFKISVR